LFLLNWLLLPRAVFHCLLHSADATLTGWVTWLASLYSFGLKTALKTCSEHLFSGQFQLWESRRNNQFAALKLSNLIFPIDKTIHREGELLRRPNVAPSAQSQIVDDPVFRNLQGFVIDELMPLVVSPVGTDHLDDHSYRSAAGDRRALFPEGLFGERHRIQHDHVGVAA